MEERLIRVYNNVGNEYENCSKYSELICWVGIDGSISQETYLDESRINVATLNPTSVLFCPLRLSQLYSAGTQQELLHRLPLSRLHHPPLLPAQQDCVRHRGGDHCGPAQRRQIASPPASDSDILDKSASGPRVLKKKEEKKRVQSPQWVKEGPKLHWMPTRSDLVRWKQKNPAIHFFGARLFLTIESTNKLSGNPLKYCDI